MLINYILLEFVVIPSHHFLSLHKQTLEHKMAKLRLAQCRAAQDGIRPRRIARGVIEC